MGITIYRTKGALCAYTLATTLYYYRENIVFVKKNVVEDLVELFWWGPLN